MLRNLLSIYFVLVASNGHAETDRFTDPTRGHPKDIAAIAQRIAMRTHFAGDEPYDAARRREIASAMKTYRCDRIDSDEAALRKRYKDNYVALAVLQKAHEW